MPAGHSQQERRGRWFVGLKLGEETAARVARQVRASLVDEAGELSPATRIYPAQDLHLTLCFLGALEEPQALADILTQELRGLWSPELRLEGVGAFPSRRQPRVLWVGLQESGAERRLEALHGRVQGAARAIGWRPPAQERARPFRPHVTVARLRQGAPAPHASFWALDFSQRWLPEEVTLFESRAQGAVERYTAFASVPLGVGPG